MADEVPYQALYRRFRPQRFSEVLGQEHVTRPLRAAVRDGRVAHAYLFSGPRGTGKTSTARILAMSLNCANPSDGEPDGTCESCVAIRQGVSLDVQELDSATNRGIDEMRELLGRVALGTPGRWKVYIIDEVHQMTSAASSALLKTLEEPPGHVIFVLATTDPQKVLETIRSRTQHFEFHLLGAEVLSALLHSVATEASIELPDQALDDVVRRGHGSARDALSALDQVAAGGGVGEAGAGVAGIVEAVAERDTGRVLEGVAEAATHGLDPRRLGTDLVEYLRNGFLATRAPSLVMLSGEAAAKAEASARSLGPAAAVRAMEVIGQALIDMRDAADPRTTLEVALVRLSAPEVDTTPAALLARIERLESRLGQRGEPAAAGTLPTPGALATGGPSRAGGGLGAPPPLPGAAAGGTAGESAGTAGISRPALGALRTRGPLVPPASSPRGAAVPVPAGVAPPAVAPSAAVSAAASAPGPPAPPSVASDLTAATPATVPAAEVDDAGSLPSRAELTVAWGDKVLSTLRPGIKAYVAAGRFVSVEGGVAVYAVPDRGLLSRAETGVPELEAALAAHFGRSVPLKLVLDDGSWSAPAPVAQPEAGDDPSQYDLDALEDAPASEAATPEQRLMDAFPGAEEVS